MSAKISAIVALSENRVIGANNTLMWNIPSDLKRLRVTTTNHPIIMGRKTFESIGRVLPNRTNIIITRQTDYFVKDAIVVSSLEEAIVEAKKIEQKEIFIFGGGEIYKQAMPIVQKLYLTLISGVFEGDTFFPNYSDFTKIIFREQHQENGYEFTFLELEK